MKRQNDAYYLYRSFKIIFNGIYRVYYKQCCSSNYYYYLQEFMCTILEEENIVMDRNEIYNLRKLMIKYLLVHGNRVRN